MRKRGLSVSPVGVRGVWLRHDLETMKKQLKVLEAKMAQEGLVLTGAQLIALARARAEKEAHAASSKASIPATAAPRTPTMGAI